MEVLFTYFFIFLFVFSTLSIMRLIVNFISALLSNPPRPFMINRGSLIYYGVTLSYLITFIIYLIT